MPMTVIEPEAGPSFAGLRRWSTVVIVFACLLQAALFPSQSNLICVGLAFAASLTVVWVCLRRRLIRSFPLSSLQILGFCSVNFVLPLLATLAELHPLNYNLRVPVRTFGYGAAFLLTLVCAHFIYRRFPAIQGLRKFVSARFFVPLGFFKAPGELQLWLMGGIGCLSRFYIYLFLPDSGVAAAGAVDKFIQPLQIFAYCPFLLAASVLYGNLTV